MTCTCPIALTRCTCWLTSGFLGGQGLRPLSVRPHCSAWHAVEAPLLLEDAELCLLPVSEANHGWVWKSHMTQFNNS